MKTLSLLVILLSSVSSYAVEEKNTFDMKIDDGTLLQAANLVNEFCVGQISPISPNNPTDEVNLEFEDITCNEAAKLLRDYDAGGKS
ncbi:MAG: hypothetical protein JKY88_02910 [Pseudomonadales bacterium]|nr:hypothetical protein [Pseudomonadales bacterium]